MRLHIAVIHTIQNNQGESKDWLQKLLVNDIVSLTFQNICLDVLNRMSTAISCQA